MNSAKHVGKNFKNHNTTHKQSTHPPRPHPLHPPTHHRLLLPHHLLWQQRYHHRHHLQLRISPTPLPHLHQLHRLPPPWPMLCQQPSVRTVIRNQQQLLLSPQQQRTLRQPTSAKILLQTRQRLTSVATLYSFVSPSSLRRASSKQFPCTAEPLTTDPCSFAAVTQFSIQLNFQSSYHLVQLIIVF